MNHLVWHEHSLTKADRRKKNKHHSAVFYFTGLSGSGKSTIANAAARYLFDLGVHTYVLDGDNIRQGLNQDLGFSETERKENIRRIGEVAKLFVDSGQVVFTAFISPFREDRATVRSLLAADEFVEVFIDCPLEVCEQRDPKGLYQKARVGEIQQFTGITSPYEPPITPELVLRTDISSIEANVQQLVDYMERRQWLSRGRS